MHVGQIKIQVYSPLHVTSVTEDSRQRWDIISTVVEDVLRMRTAHQNEDEIQGDSGSWVGLTSF